MSTLWQDIQYKMLRSGSRLNQLIWVNIIVYLAINIPVVLEHLFFHSNYITKVTDDYLGLTAYLPKLLTRFWTPFTYMFMHGGPFHILFNMIWLYWFGQIFEEFLGKKRILGLFLMGGLVGGFFFVLCFNTIPAFTVANAALGSSLVGASAGVMAVIVGTATLVPDYTMFIIFLGPIKLKWIALFYVVLDFLSLTGFNPGGEISHLGGALMGYIYIKQLQKGNDLPAIIGKWFKPRPHLKVVSNNTSRGSSARPRQEEIDFILDKISKSGYDNLSKQEKEILFRASKND